MRAATCCHGAAYRGDFRALVGKPHRRRKQPSLLRLASQTSENLGNMLTRWLAFLSSIYDKGILSETRQYVHLSPTKEIATKVGSRHGKPYVLGIDCKRMVSDGIKFYLSRNGVWLTKYVDPKYLLTI